MKKILIMANNDIGLYKFRKEIIEELVKKYKVYISLPNGEYIKQLTDIGCKFINTPINRRGINPLVDLKLFVKYIQTIKEIEPDLVLTYTIKPNVFGGLACKINKTPYITNITGLGTALESGGILQKITLFLYKVSLTKSKCIFFQNEANRDFMDEMGVINGGHKLIPGSGVNLNYFELLEFPSHKTINFLFIARVMKEKGIDQYLETSEYIKKRYPYTQFHILGFCEEVYEERLRKLQKKGIITYHGMQNDVREFHKHSHCTIHPTYYPEGMSNVLLESAALGRPIITTNKAGCREIVEDGKNGYLVKQQDSQELIEKVEKFIALDQEEKKRMGLAGRNKVEEEFDRDIVVKSYIKEVEKILG